MYQIGLLLLTGSFRLVAEQISQYLKCANKNVIKRLYVKLEPEFNKPYTKSEVIYLRQLSNFVPLVYNKASRICQNLDVRVVLSDTKKRKAERDNPSKFDVVLTNSKDEIRNIENYIDYHFMEKCDNIIKLNEKEVCGSDDPNCVPSSEFKIFKTVCLGGTFDRLHNGHKVLLSEAALRASEKLIVGVTDGPMLKKKVLWELIEPIEKRIADVTTFLVDVDPSLHYEVVPIIDPYGPTITDPNINCIVVSAETKIGGDRVNIERKKRGMNELTMYIVNLVENADKIPGEEEKISSSTARMHLLGTCLKAPQVTSSNFYCIFLQGKPMTGKSCISNKIKNLGAGVIYCSDIIKMILNNERDVRDAFCNKFEENMLKEDQSIDYKKLVQLCLKDKEKRQWTALNLSEKVYTEVKDKLQFYQKEGMKLTLIQDSLLLDGSFKYRDVNEVWSTVISSDEVVKRLRNVYDLSEADAANAILSLPTNEYYFEKSNRIFCNQWSHIITDQQISRAWSQLKQI